jgi:RNA polymerase sigma-70 factor (ECF subfamily)
MLSTASRRHAVSRNQWIAGEKGVNDEKKQHCPIYAFSASLTTSGLAVDVSTAGLVENLIHLAQRGDCTARGRLFELLRTDLERLAQAQIGPVLRGKVDSDDVLQETFLLAHREFARFRGTTGSELMGWLRVILLTNVAMVVRHYCGTGRRNVKLEQPLPYIPRRRSRKLLTSAFTDDEPPENRLLSHEQARRVFRALGKLPSAHREAVMLRHQQGLSYAEIAARMSRSVGSVKKLSTRGLSALRREVADEE